MGKIIIYLLLFVITLSAGYTLVNLDFRYLPELMRFDITSADPRTGVEIVCNELEMERIQNLGLPYSIKIEDMEAFYQSRLSPTSMGGYHTYNEIIGIMDSLRAMSPHIISEKFSIGEGWEGNQIWAYKISDNVAIDEDEPEILLDGSIHCREVISQEILIAFSEWLTAEYGEDPIATYLVDNREIWFIPIVNPDGYIYNEDIAPSGGGMWRKNRRDNGDGTMGVDLNRNFGFMWGYDDLGSSPITYDETYRGVSGFSEPETQAYRDFVNTREFRTNISYHSASNLYHWPWGWTTEPTDDQYIFMEMGAQMARYNGFPYGPGSTTIYLVNGGTFDWMYGDESDHDPIFSWSPEVGSDEDGFWPPESRIEPLIAEHLWDCIYMCLAAGSCPMVLSTEVFDTSGDGSGYPDPGETVEMTVVIRNRGLGEAYDVVVELTPVTGVETVIEDMVYVGDIASFTSSDGVGTFRFVIDPDLEMDDEVIIRLTTTDPDRYWYEDTIRFNVGTPYVIYQNDFEDSSAFAAGGDWEWGAPTYGVDAAYSGDNLWATRLREAYSNESTVSSLTTPSFTLPDDCDIIRFSFWNWYSCESDPTTYYDGGNVKISVDGDPFFVIDPEAGYDGILWSYNPLSGQRCFSGNSNGWQRESFDLSGYGGHEIVFQFTFASDPAVNAAGWYIDDFMVYGFHEDRVSEVPTPDRLEYLAVYPNPFNGSCAVNSSLPVDIYDLSGKTVAKGVQGIWEPINNVPSGIYLMKLRNGKTDIQKRVLYLK